MKNEGVWKFKAVFLSNTRSSKCPENVTGEPHLSNRNERNEYRNRVETEKASLQDAMQHAPQVSAHLQSLLQLLLLQSAAFPRADFQAFEKREHREEGMVKPIS